jgi:trehalose 6-phosphate synthase/phosphatase
MKQKGSYMIISFAKNALYQIKNKCAPMLANENIYISLIDDFDKSNSRLVILDYDGTLVPFSKDPEKAVPDEKLISILRKLIYDTRNNIVIISGRPKVFLDKHFSALPIILASEHGAYIKYNNIAWETVAEDDGTWKDAGRHIIGTVCRIIPGSTLEEKDFSLVWHYRNINKDLAARGEAILQNAIQNSKIRNQIDILEGHKVLEIRTKNVNKGMAVQHMRMMKTYDFILCAGDDCTDEDMFASLPENAYTIKIGKGESIAKYRMCGISSFRKLLSRLTL